MGFLAAILDLRPNLRWPRTSFFQIVWSKVHESSEKTLTGKKGSFYLAWTWLLAMLHGVALTLVCVAYEGGANVLDGRLNFTRHFTLSVWNATNVESKLETGKIPVIDSYRYTLCPRKNCTPRQCTIELSSPKFRTHPNQIACAWLWIYLRQNCQIS